MNKQTAKKNKQTDNPNRPPSNKQMNTREIKSWQQSTFMSKVFFSLKFSVVLDMQQKGLLT